MYKKNTKQWSFKVFKNRTNIDSMSTGRKSSSTGENVFLRKLNWLILSLYAIHCHRHVPMKSKVDSRSGKLPNKLKLTIGRMRNEKKIESFNSPYIANLKPIEFQTKLFLSLPLSGHILWSILDDRLETNMAWIRRERTHSMTSTMQVGCGIWVERNNFFWRFLGASMRICEIVW